MNRIELKKHYLAAMGIVSWRERAVMVAGSTKCFSYQLYRKAKERCGLLIANASSDTHQQQIEKELLLKIIEALNLSASGTLLELTNNNVEITTQDQVVILLGDAVSDIRNPRENICVVRSHSLANLIANPELKRETWRQLQAVISMLKV